MAHAAMVRYQSVLVGKISARFSDLMDQLRATSWKDETESEELLRQIRQAQEARDLVRKQVPVWPFNAVSLRRFLGLLFSPLLAAIISALVNLVFSF